MGVNLICGAILEILPSLHEFALASLTFYSFLLKHSPKNKIDVVIDSRISFGECHFVYVV